MSSAPNASSRALRRFTALWALSWAVKIGLLALFLLILIQLTGGH